MLDKKSFFYRYNKEKYYLYYKDFNTLIDKYVII